MATAKRSYRSAPPPWKVLLIGCSTTWSESMPPGHRPRPAPHPTDCRCGCVRPSPIYRLAGRVAVLMPDWLPTSRLQGERPDCPNGCDRRDLPSERRRGFNRVCLRCLCHTNDREGWRLPIPLVVAREGKKARAKAARAASLGYRKFHGRKVARAAI